MSSESPVRRILFVCAGNICRSAIAEAALRRLVGDRIEIESAGLVAKPGDVPIDATLRAALRASLDLSAHRARRFVPAMVTPDTRVFAMEASQREEILAATGAPSDRVESLASLTRSPADIADPFGRDDPGFDECVRRILEGTDALAERLGASRP